MTSAVSYRQHYEAKGEGMIQGHVTDETPRWAVPSFFATQVPGQRLRLLDIGCGDGDIGRRFAALPWVASVTMVDVALSSVTKAHRWYRLPGAVAWAERLPFRAQEFDLALLIAVLEHVLDPAAVVAEAERVARYIVAVVPGQPDDDPEHVRVYDLAATARLRGGWVVTDGKEVFALWGRRSNDG